MGNNDDFELVIEPIYKLRIKSQIFPLTREEALSLKRILNVAFPEPIPYEKLGKIAESVRQKMNSSAVKVNPILAPKGYTYAFSSPCEKASGHNSMYHYFHDFDGLDANWKASFDIKQQPVNIGKIGDPKSMIGRFLHILPLDKSLTKSEMKKIEGYSVSDDQRLKAVVDILENQKYLQRDTPRADHKVRYIRNQKTVVAIDIAPQLTR